jgi:hypothetical protein
LSGKALNQDVTLMTGILKSKELHVSNDNKRFCREMLKYTLRHLLMQKLEQEALFTFMGVQNKLKKHFWRDYHRKNNNMYL